MLKQSEIEIGPVELPQVWKMRREIMYPTFDIDAMKLELDEQGEHLGLYVEGRVVSVISLFVDQNELQFRKFCTLNECQGKGYGSQLLQYVFNNAKQDPNIKSIWCNARLTAKAIYERFGMETTDQTYTKDGFDFVVMKLPSFSS